MCNNSLRPAWPRLRAGPSISSVKYDREESSTRDMMEVCRISYRVMICLLPLNVIYPDIPLGNLKRQVQGSPL